MPAAGDCRIRTCLSPPCSHLNAQPASDQLRRGDDGHSAVSHLQTPSRYVPSTSVGMSLGKRNARSDGS